MSARGANPNVSTPCESQRGRRTLNKSQRAAKTIKSVPRMNLSAGGAPYINLSAGGAQTALALLQRSRRSLRQHPWRSARVVSVMVGCSKIYQTPIGFHSILDEPSGGRRLPWTDAREGGELRACIGLVNGRWKTTGEDWTRHRAVTEGEKSSMASSMRNDPIPKSQWWESQEMADYIKASVLSQ